MKTIQVFIPEYIPLENRGEEAILRGLQDVLFPDNPVHFHILGFCNRVTETFDDVTVYPYRWFYPVWVFREFFVSWHPLDIVNTMGMLFNAGRNRLPILAGKPHVAVWFNAMLTDSSGFVGRLWRKRKLALKRLAGVDFILAGHDNAMGLREAHLLRSIANHGKPYGIFGCGMNSHFANATVADVFRSVFKRAEFLFFRDRASWEGVYKGCGLDEARLAPDPAFGMRPAEDSAIDAVLAKEDLLSFFSKPVVAMTVVENAVIMHSFKAQRSIRQKVEMHYHLVGRLVNHLVQSCGVHVLFLPHCTGPTSRLDDRRVARAVLRHANASEGTARILDKAYDARILKGLIKRCSLLIGERTHSLISAISNGTPFVCLGNLSDKRTTEIIGTMCEAGDLVYDLTAPNEESLCVFVEKIWKTRTEQRARVTKIGKAINQELVKAAEVARAQIARHVYPSNSPN